MRKKCGFWKLRNTSKNEVLLNEYYFDDAVCIINEFLDKEVKKSCEAFLSKCGVLKESP